jgi:hypothetical protein
MEGYALENPVSLRNQSRNIRRFGATRGAGSRKLESLDEVPRASQI